jgi:phosphate transport system substrate-binding protein
MSNVKFFNNDEGVSPIVATLVLIVVAIVGAAAVGLIMGSFSNSVSDQANAGDTAGQASTTLTVGGSTTLQPINTLMAKYYMQNKTGVKVNVMGGGSGAGETGAAQGLLDIGCASEDLTAYLAAHPGLKAVEVGKAVVVVITPTSNPVATITQAELVDAYTKGVGTVGALTGYTAVTRSDASGTADTFAKYLGVSNIYDTSKGQKPVSGNPGMISEISTTTGKEVGYTDFGYASGVSAVTIAALDSTSGVVNSANLKAQIKGTSTINYPSTLIRPLNYIVKQNPSAITQDFINFVTSPVNKDAFGQLGMFSLYDYS